MTSSDDRDAPRLGGSVPLLIVRDVAASAAHYRDALGFEVALLVPPERPFLARVVRGGAALLLKEIAPDVPPLPNRERHGWARWDVFVPTNDPDALCAELASRGATLHAPLADTDDGLRLFEVRDVDGYVIAFGRPLTAPRGRAPPSADRGDAPT